MQFIQQQQRHIHSDTYARSCRRVYGGTSSIFHITSLGFVQQAFDAIMGGILEVCWTRAQPASAAAATQQLLTAVAQ